MQRAQQDFNFNIWLLNRHTQRQHQQLARLVPEAQEARSSADAGVPDRPDRAVHAVILAAVMSAGANSNRRSSVSAA
jgi:hypothetical protein